MTILSIDIGTTHCKFALLGEDLGVRAMIIRDTVTHRDVDGYFHYDPLEVWQTVAGALHELCREDRGRQVAAIGICSTAETGILVSRVDGTFRSELIPWFDRRTMEEAKLIERQAPGVTRFAMTGLHGSYKYGLSKLLWLKSRRDVSFSGAVWLSMSDFIAWKLSGRFATDYTLAARTYAFDINTKRWRSDWLAEFGFDTELFPDAHPSGSVIGRVTRENAHALGLNDNVAVCIGGHDHVCASLGAGAVGEADVFSSIGTAETLIGNLPETPLGQAEYESGLSFGCHFLAGRFFWMGNLPSSGGSVEWIRRCLSSTGLSYGELENYLAEAPQGPTGILFMPHLAGSGSPLPNQNAKASFVGLTQNHGREEIVKAVFEGICMQFRCICETSASLTGRSTAEIIAVGGGTKNRTWMQMKADIAGLLLRIPAVVEGTLLGTAALAGLNTGLFTNARQVAALIAANGEKRIEPHHEVYDSYSTQISQFEKLLAIFNHWYRDQ